MPLPSLRSIWPLAGARFETATPSKRAYGAQKVARALQFAEASSPAARAAMVVNPSDCAAKLAIHSL